MRKNIVKEAEPLSTLKGLIWKHFFSDHLRQNEQSYTSKMTEGTEEVWEGLILGKLMIDEFDILCRVRKNLRYSGIDTYVLPPILPQHSYTYSLESSTNS